MILVLDRDRDCQGADITLVCLSGPVLLRAAVLLTCRFKIS